MNSSILIGDFMNKSRQSIELLSLELSKPNIDIKESLIKIKQLRSNLVHIHNLLKLEESLEKERA